jgi:uncharacterized surface anchored protein
MTRTDFMASSRPQKEGAAKVGPGRTGRRLLVLPVVLLLALAAIAPVSALAASTTTNKEGLGGYTKTTPTTETKTTPTTKTPTTETKTTPTTPEKEKSGTSPTTETSTPKTTTPGSSTSPSSETAKAATLPFTGLDLRWMIGLGLLLAGVGVSIVTVQHRHGRDGR